jgi:hypothetical protein
MRLVYVGAALTPKCKRSGVTEPPRICTEADPAKGERQRNNFIFEGELAIFKKIQTHAFIASS